MRTIIAILLFISLVAPCSAQSLALGERAPKLKLHKSQFEEHEYLYMGFIHSASQPCLTTTGNINKVIAQFSNIKMVLLTREKEGEYQPWLKQLREQGITIYPNATKVFQKYGIDYAPFGVIMDTKRRVLWFGNPQRVDSNRVIKIINRWTSQR